MAVSGSTSGVFETLYTLKEIKEISVGLSVLLEAARGEVVDEGARRDLKAELKKAGTEEKKVMEVAVLCFNPIAILTAHGREEFPEIPDAAWTHFPQHFLLDMYLSLFDGRDVEVRDNVYRNKILTLLANNDVESALRVARKITEKKANLESIILAEMEQGNLEGALELYRVLDPDIDDEDITIKIFDDYITLCSQNVEQAIAYTRERFDNELQDLFVRYALVCFNRQLKELESINLNFVPDALFLDEQVGCSVRAACYKRATECGDVPAVFAIADQSPETFPLKDDIESIYAYRAMRRGKTLRDEVREIADLDLKERVSVLLFFESHWITDSSSEEGESIFSSTPPDGNPIEAIEDALWDGDQEKADALIGMFKEMPDALFPVGFFGLDQTDRDFAFSLHMLEQIIPDVEWRDHEKKIRIFLEKTNEDKYAKAWAYASKKFSGAEVENIKTFLHAYIRSQVELEIRVVFGLDASNGEPRNVPDDYFVEGEFDDNLEYQIMSYLVLYREALKKCRFELALRTLQSVRKWGGEGTLDDIDVQRDLYDSIDTALVEGRLSTNDLRKEIISIGNLATQTDLLSHLRQVSPYYASVEGEVLGNHGESGVTTA